MSDPQSCGQCECCAAWRADRDRLLRALYEVNREREGALRSIDRRNADLVDMNARLDALGYDDIKRRIAAMVEGA